jgi:hypothetical protein
VRCLITFAILFAIGHAMAAPASTRVVLVDPDPELRRAMTTALRPWKLEVIVDPTPIEEPGAPARATALNARFVVWRRGKDLVVFDREKGDTQHRDVTAGTMDPVDAASAALTVKTLMRLPAPPEDRAPDPPVASTREVRVQAGAATRIAKGSQTAVGGRFIGAVTFRPTGQLRVGVLGDVGTSDSFSVANFEGRWSDWSLLALASWTSVHGKIEIEPFVALGVTRSSVDGSEGGGGNPMTIDDAETLGAIRAGAWVRYRLGVFTLGASASLDAALGTPTYTRMPNNKTLYEVPSVGVTLGLVVAADLGR